MQSHPDIDALRDDDSPQREAQNGLTQAREDWAASEQSLRIFADMADYAQGADLADCPDLSRLFAPDEGEAGVWVDDLIGAMARTLHDHPLGHVPLRHFASGVMSSLLLGRSGEVTLALTCVSGTALAQQSSSPSVSFAPLESHERILAGYADAEMIACASPGEPEMSLERAPLRLRPGAVIARDGAHEAMRLLRVEGALVSLRLQRRLRSGAVSHEYDLASGRLLHRAAGVMRDSRHALMVNLLGRMGRRDAVPVLAAITRETASDDLRWQALREGLGLDTAQGFRSLCAVASSPDDPLAPAAQALRAGLVWQYPMLRQIV